MPYIKQEARQKWSGIELEKCDSEGELNYLITRLCRGYIDQEGESYATYNAVIGVLECAKQELYRRRIALYEDKAIERNGDVYDNIN